jgi:hypothetical protein
MSHQPQHGVGITGSTLVQQVTMVLTDAQIKALPTTAITLVTAPGLGRVILPLLAYLRLVRAAAYTNVDADDASLYLSNGAAATGLLRNSADQTSLTGLLEGSAGTSVVSLIPASAYDMSDVAPVGIVAAESTLANKPLTLVVGNNAAGVFTGGNAGNSLQITVLYTVVDSL